MSTVSWTAWRLWQRVGQIEARSGELQGVSDAGLTELARALRWRVREQPTSPGPAVEVFALVREVARRVLNKPHYSVQLYGGLVMAQGAVAEMQTGEGKTLTATLAAVLRAFAGRGCHVLTSNDYLAERDADELRPVYQQLRLSVGCVLPDHDTDQRRAAYACDITYGTASEMGFDFLRDRLRREASGALEESRPAWLQTTGGGEPPVQRGHFFALIDEADSVLIDEGRTPLIIGLEVPAKATDQVVWDWCRQAAAALQIVRDYKFDGIKRSAELTDEGCRRLLLQTRPGPVRRLSAEVLFHRVETSLRALRGFQRDVDYVVLDDEVKIVDESTGRSLDGRKWQDGLHQAVEAKEGVPLSPATGLAAQMTLQRYFQQYAQLAGMTGTARPARREFRGTYRLPVIRVPTHRPCRRQGQRTRIFATAKEKYQAIAASVDRLLRAGRSVLIGTPSVESSEALGQVLEAAGIVHRVLNARQHAVEAEIVAEAGQPRRVTVATNMAGRGTDILLAESVRAAGGLHVIGCELHSSPRIDRQLIGRCARQGDPGSCQFFLSLEDDLLQQACPLAAIRWRKRWPSGELSVWRWMRTFWSAQRRVERRQRRERKQLLRRERDQWKASQGMGLDPCLDLVHE